MTIQLSKIIFKVTCQVNIKCGTWIKHRKAIPQFTQVWQNAEGVGQAAFYALGTRIVYAP